MAKWTWRYEDETNIQTTETIIPENIAKIQDELTAHLVEMQGDVWVVDENYGKETTGG